MRPPRRRRRLIRPPARLAQHRQQAARVRWLRSLPPALLPAPAQQQPHRPVHLQQRPLQRPARPWLTSAGSRHRPVPAARRAALAALQQPPRLRRVLPRPPAHRPAWRSAPRCQHPTMQTRQPRLHRALRCRRRTQRHRRPQLSPKLGWLLRRPTAPAAVRLRQLLRRAAQPRRQAPRQPAPLRPARPAWRPRLRLPVLRWPAAVRHPAQPVPTAQRWQQPATTTQPWRLRAG